MKSPGNETWAIVSLLFMSIYRYTLCIRQILVRTARSLSAVAACCRCCFAFNWIDDRLREIVSRSSPTYNSINLPFTMCSHILERVYWTHLHFYKQVCFEILLLYLYFHVDAMREVSRLVSSRLVCHPQLIMPIPIPILIHIVICIPFATLYGPVLLSFVCFIATHLKFP